MARAARLPSVGHLAHLARRFATSLWPAGPSPDDAAWADARLLAGERALWARMSPVDRRHAAGVARRVDAALGGRAPRPVLAAALLHDSGKAASGLGTFARVGATVAGAAVGHDPARRAAWAASPGVRGRVGRYLDHPAIGARLLAEAGSDPLTVAWAAEHHLPPSAWTVPEPYCSALKAADDD